MWRYTIILTPEPDGSAFNVTVPALPGCFTCGLTREEAIDNAREAITVHIQGLELDGEPVPEERASPELVLVEP